jgi:RNA polymerase sigma-70 factor (ECF subfamily)
MPPVPDFADDPTLVAALRARDERAFEWLLDRYRSPLLHLARRHVPSNAVAEEVVQDAFLAVFQGIDRFEARSSLKTWLYRIVLNLARTRGVREHRSTPFSAAAPDAGDERAVEAEWFFDAHQDKERHWRSAPKRWEGLPEDRAIAAEIRAALENALTTLPPVQRDVIVMRDVLGVSSAEVCNALDLTETNQRVLLHRARVRLRSALDEYYTEST